MLIYIHTLHINPTSLFLHCVSLSRDKIWRKNKTFVFCKNVPLRPSEGDMGLVRPQSICFTTYFIVFHPPLHFVSATWLEMSGLWRDCIRVGVTFSIGQNWEHTSGRKDIYKKIKIAMVAVEVLIVSIILLFCSGEGRTNTSGRDQRAARMENFHFLQNLNPIRAVWGR